MLKVDYILVRAGKWLPKRPRFLGFFFKNLKRLQFRFFRFLYFGEILYRSYTVFGKKRSH